MMERRRADLDLSDITEAFEVMGRYLRERECLGEIAVYGGTGILLQFDWRKTTEDVDAVILTGQREGVVKDAVAYAALMLGLADAWLNTFVGGFTPDVEPATFFSAFDTYPRGECPGLRVILAKPEYLCAMKLKALRRANVGDRDFEDAVNLAREVGVSSAAELDALFKTFFPDEKLDPVAAARLPEVAAAIRPKKAG